MSWLEASWWNALIPGALTVAAWLIIARTLKPPAGGEDPAGTPRTAPDHHLPGPIVYDTRHRERDCGCFEVINHIHHTRRLMRCQRHAFEHHWEARLNDQQPR